MTRPSSEGKLFEISRALLDMTRSRSLWWDVDESPGGFTAELPHGSVVVGPELISVRSPGGVVVEELGYKAVDPEPEGSEGSFRALVEELYERARRQVLAVDETLDAVLDDLGHAGAGSSPLNGRTTQRGITPPVRR